MSGAKFASLHGGLLARKGLATPAVATPEIATPAVAKSETEEPVPERAPEAGAELLGTLAAESVDEIEQCKPDQGPPAAESSRSASEPWDGIDRRKEDRGPPPGTPGRRRPIFGKRNSVPVPASDAILKRFNA
jgi:hypothetical protein